MMNWFVAVCVRARVCVCVYICRAQDTCCVQHGCFALPLSNLCRTTTATNKYRNAYTTKTMGDQIDSLYAHTQTPIIAR